MAARFPAIVRSSPWQQAYAVLDQAQAVKAMERVV